MPELLDADDAKLVTLARSVRVRHAAREAAAVRDSTGRTYVGAPVELSSLRLSALQSAIAAAVSSGAESLEAAVVVSESETVDAEGLAAVAEVSGGTCPVYLVGTDSQLRTRLLPSAAS